MLLVENQEQYAQADELQQINMDWNIIKDSINHGNQVVPEKKKVTNKPWISDEILDLMKERKNNKSNDKYHKLNKEIQKKCREAKESWVNHRCRTIEIFGLSSKEANDDIKVLSGMCRSGRRSQCIKNKEGKILFDQEDIQNRWCEYIGELFDATRSNVPVPSTLEGPPILKAEVENALNKMKDGKAQGGDNISTEMLKVLEVFTLNKLTDLFNRIYNTGHIPDELAKSIFIPLPKKPKAMECGDYRTISLMPHVTKLLLKVILERMKKKIGEEVSETQFGFKSGSGTREAIFCLNNAIQTYHEKEKEIYACFIDYAKAFDSVQHEEIIQCLERAGIDGKDIRTITNLYWHQKAAIKSQGEPSSYIEIKKGVRQGCVLSPYLFNLYTEFIFRKTEQLPGISIGGRNINNLRYADDTVLLAEDINKLQDIVDQVKENSLEKGLRMNTSKTKVMIMSRKPGKAINVKIDDVQLEQVSSYKYLGQKVVNLGSCKEEVKTRIAIARKRFIDLKSILTCDHMQIATRTRILKCYVHSVLLYGSETWTLNKELERKINAFEMWTIRRMGKISWKEKKTNKEVCDQMNMRQELLNTVKSRKLKYFGHIKRHSTICKEILEGGVEGKRQRGRPPRKWNDDIKSWTGHSLAECTRLAENREVWRRISSRPLAR